MGGMLTESSALAFPCFNKMDHTHFKLSVGRQPSAVVRIRFEIEGPGRLVRSHVTMDPFCLAAQRISAFRVYLPRQ